MPETDLHQPDLDPLRTAAEAAELAQAASGLLSAYGCLLSLDWDRLGTYTGIRQAMNTVISGILHSFGYAIAPFGSCGAWLLTGRHRQETGAAR